MYVICDAKNTWKFVELEQLPDPGDCVRSVMCWICVGSEMGDYGDAENLF